MFIIYVYACALEDDVSNDPDLGIIHVKKLRRYNMSETYDSYKPLVYISTWMPRHLAYFR